MSDTVQRISDVSGFESMRTKIDAAKATLRGKYSVCRSSARRLSGAYARLIDAESKLDLKPTSRLISKHAMQEAEYNVALKEYYSCAELYNSLIEQVLLLYDEYYLSSSGRAAKKIKAESVKFEAQQYKAKQKIMEAAKDVTDAIGAFDKAAQSAGPDEEKAEKLKSLDSIAPQARPQEPTLPATPQGTYYAQQPMDAYRPYMPQGVNIAPMSIDISSIVADAVAAAMEKFKIAFDKKANAFIESMPGEAEAKEAPVSVSDKDAEVLSAVILEETVITEKLSALIENLKKLSEEMTALGAAYMQLSNTQRDAAELQRRINDMQRALSREIQGVQANQKVINQDQAAVSAEQAVVMEEQKASVEGQKLVTESQENISEMQKAVVETQRALEASVREVLTTQKDMINAQQSLLVASAKNIELQADLEKRQAEMTEMQKTVLSAHKQLFRAQRAFAAKNVTSEKKEKQKEALPLPEDVVLEEIEAEK